jgi:hypothetical protein
MAGVNFDFIIAITLLNSESLVLIFGRSAQVGFVIAPLPGHCEDCHGPPRRKLLAAKGCSSQ